MWERPDNRVWFFFAPVLPLAIAFGVFPSEHPVGRLVEPVLYAYFIFLGGGLGTLSFREGYSLLHPSSTVDNWAFLYWSDVVACFLFAGLAAWKTIKVLTVAL